MISITDYFVTIEDALKKSGLEKHEFIKELLSLSYTHEPHKNVKCPYMLVIFDALKKHDSMFGPPFFNSGDPMWGFHAVNQFLNNSVGIFMANKDYAVEDCRRYYFYNHHNLPINFIDRENLLKEFLSNYMELAIIAFGQSYVYYIKRYRTDQRYARFRST